MFNDWDKLVQVAAAHALLKKGIKDERIKEVLLECAGCGLREDLPLWAIESGWEIDVRKAAKQALILANYASEELIALNAPRSYERKEGARSLENRASPLSDEEKARLYDAMFNDWNKLVKIAAARALYKKGIKDERIKEVLLDCVRFTAENVDDERKVRQAADDALKIINEVSDVSATNYGNGLLANSNTPVITRQQMVSHKQQLTPGMVSSENPPPPAKILQSTFFYTSQPKAPGVAEIAGLNEAQTRTIVRICHLKSPADGLYDELVDALKRWVGPFSPSEFCFYDDGSPSHGAALISLMTTFKGALSAKDAVAEIQGLNVYQADAIKILCDRLGPIHGLGDALREWTSSVPFNSTARDNLCRTLQAKLRRPSVFGSRPYNPSSAVATVERSMVK